MTTRNAARSSSIVSELADFGAYAQVGFSVERLDATKVLWLNTRWALSEGYDATSLQVRKSIGSWLIKEFGVEASVGGGGGVMYADRYGASGGAFHGGSGRSGSSGAYNAKGIGATPLASNLVEWSHRHGFLSLEEALKEVVLSELVDSEAPCKAIPIIAVLDCGENFVFSQDGLPRRRAIVVRQNFLRPAHVERSLYFGSSGTRSSDQFMDALRVKDYVRRLFGVGEFSAQLRLEDVFRKYCVQVGACRAHRLWQGQFTTSNIALHGEAVDFGSFRSVASWRRAQGSVGEIFGGEEDALLTAYRSTSYYIGKYGGRPDRLPQDDMMAQQISRWVEQGFLEATLAGCGFTKEAPQSYAEQVGSLFLCYYSLQQKELIKVDNPVDIARPWLYDEINASGSNPYGDNLDSARVALELKKLLQEVSKSQCGSSAYVDHLALARYWLRPRPSLYYRELEAVVSAFCSALLQKGGDSLTISAFLNCQISRARRFWPRLPEGLEVVAQFTDPTSTYLICKRFRDGSYVAYLEAMTFKGIAVFFGQWLPLESVRDVSLVTEQGYVFIEKPVKESAAFTSSCFQWGNLEVRAPRPVVLRRD